MSRDARVELDWADGTYAFRLAWAQLAELQEKTNAGPYVVFARLESDVWRIEDIAHTIRLGLIGGGMPPTDALKKVRTYVEERPLLESVPLAKTILQVALVGAPEEDLGNGAGAGQEIASTTSPTVS